MTRKPAISILLVVSMLWAQAAPAFAALATGPAAPGAVPGVGVRVGGLAPLTTPMSAPTLSPALPGEALASGVTPSLPTPLTAPALRAAASPAQAAAMAAPALAAPSAINAVTPAAAVPSALPSAFPIKTPAEAAQVPGAPRATVLSAAGAFANAVSQPGKGADVSGRSRKVFDGGAKPGDAEAPAVPGAPGAHASGGGAGGLIPSDGSGDGGQPGPGEARSEVSFRAAKDGSDIVTNIPQTLVVNDSFGGTAPDADVARLQALIDRGVHVVFMTDRPDRGAGSADEVLISKLKPGKDNPVTVASYAGARISFVAAEGGVSRWTMASEAGAFEPREIERFNATAKRVLAAMRVEGSAAAVPDSAFHYTLHLPESIPAADLEARRKTFVTKFNNSMSAAGLPYRMRADVGFPRSVSVLALSQPLALGRVSAALEGRFADVAEKGRETQLLADQALRDMVAAAPAAVPGALRGAALAAPADAAALSAALAAIAGDGALPAADVSMTDLRSHIDFWKPAFKAKSKGGKAGLGQFGLYTWKVLHGLMTDFYVDAAQAGNKYPSLKMLLEELDRRWAGKTGERSFDSFRARTGKAASDEYLRHARTFVANFWNREVGDYTLAKDEIRANLMTEGSVFTSIPLRSPFTGRRYTLGVSVDRVMKLNTARGRELNATVYRFGREEATEGDSANARAVALAVLRAYGRKGTDLRWHQQSITGPVIARISVQVEYLKNSRVFDFSPEELLAIESDGTLTQGPETLALVNAMEREQSDVAYLKTLKKAGKRAEPTAWGGDEWARNGGAVRALFAQYWPAAETSPAKRFMSAADASRTLPVAQTRPDVLVEPVRWPAEPLPQAVLEDGSQIEGVTAAPRVVFIEDVFEGPASEVTVAYVQKLIDHGAHVVFMTARPHMGPGSADEVLLGRLKVSQKNPPIVVSYNGARIALHSHAKDPKPYIADSDAFSPEALAAFKKTAAELTAAMGLGAPAEAVTPSEGAAFLYTLRVPDSVPAEELGAVKKTLARRFNAALAAAGQTYTLQAHPDDARLMWVRSQPLRMSLERVFEALDTRFKGEDLLSHPMTFLVLGDSNRSLKLSTAWPKGVTFRPAAGDADVSRQIGVVLGDYTRKPVGVKLGEIRQWDEFWAPMLLRKGGGRASPGDNAKAVAGSWGADRGYNGPMGMFTGSLFYRLMPSLIENIWRGQDRLTTLTQGEKLLRQMWKKPVEHGVFVSRKQAALMHEAGWKERSNGYLDRALAIFRETYNRMFERYSEAAADIMHNLAGLTTDAHSLITVPFVAGNTLYKVMTRLPRLMKHDTAEGRVLTVHAHRTGKQPFEGDGDSVYARTLAMAMLVGFASPGPDGVWHDGWAEGPRIAKLHVRFEYKDGGLDLYFNPNDFFTILPNGKLRQGPIVREIANTIERMRADQEFQEHYKAEVEEAKPEDLKKKKTETKDGGK